MPIEISLPDGRHPKARHRGPGWQSWPTQIYVRAIGLPRAASEWRSEVKEEDRAQSGPGDMSEAAHPLFWAACSADLTRWLAAMLRSCPPAPSPNSLRKTASQQVFADLVGNRS